MKEVANTPKKQNERRSLRKSARQVNRRKTLLLIFKAQPYKNYQINIKVMLRTKTIRKLRRGSDSDEESLFGEDNLDGSLLSRTKSSPYRWRVKQVS